MQARFVGSLWKLLRLDHGRRGRHKLSACSCYGMGPYIILTDCKDKTASTSSPEILTICPEPECGDKIPHARSKNLQSAVRQYVAISHDDRHETIGKRAMLSLQLCIAIKQDLKIPLLKASATEHGWPPEPDVQSLEHRLLDTALRPEVMSIVNNDIVLYCSTAWTTFITTLKSRRIPLARFRTFDTRKKFDLMSFNFHTG